MSDPPSQINTTQNKNIQDHKKEKIGHRRVNAEGTVTYKKKTTSEIQKAIQLGVNISVGSINSKPKRDMLLKDFGAVELTSIPKSGTRTTPAHQLSDFQFRTYAPIAFRYFRDMFKVDMCEFMDSICTKELRELSNPGASGSIFYITLDNEFIIKTVQKKEAKFLQKLLPEYYINLMQHPRTLLPKFYGLYCYETMGKNIRFIVMNNLLPAIKIHEKYDLKGSTYKRYASKKERSKPCPTLKDLDFKENYPDGLTLEPETYDALMTTISRDCMVLESFSIMDFSLLLGIHNVDQDRLDRHLKATENNRKSSLIDPVMLESGSGEETAGGDSNISALNRTEPTRSSSHARSIKRIAAYCTPLEAIQRDSNTVLREYNDTHDLSQGGIPARNNKGERLYLYLGIIDILQSYQVNKKLEHGFKSLLHDGETISVTNPTFYKQRFQDFFSKFVFKKASQTESKKFKKLANFGMRNVKRRQSKITEPMEQRMYNQRSKSEVYSSEPNVVEVCMPHSNFNSNTQTIVEKTHIEQPHDKINIIQLSRSYFHDEVVINRQSTQL